VQIPNIRSLRGGVPCTSSQTRAATSGEDLVIEQRKSRRFELKLPLQLVRCGRSSVTSHGETRNLSSSGVLFSADAHVNIGDPVEYVITLPSDSPSSDVRLKCLGKVVRNEGDEAAATLERYEFVRERR
jgi:hypothetical protein